MGGPGSGAKPKIYPPELVDAVERLYTDGHTQVEVAAELGITQKVVWRLMRRHDIKRRPQVKRNQFGPRNHMWKGNDAGYQALHARVEKRRGKPKQCEWCGSNEPDKTYNWANLTGEYTDPNDFVRLCLPCHRKLDQDSYPRDEATGRFLPVQGGDAQCP